MTRDKIISAAREAGLKDLGGGNMAALERFAALVAAAEREACCEIVDYELDSNGNAEAIKIAIRARSHA